MEDLMQHIYKARELAIKNGIEKSMIIIDTDVAHVNQFYIKEPGGLLTVPEMIMGMKVKYDKNLSYLTGVNFVITEDKLPDLYQQKTLSDYTTDELLEELKRRCE